MKLFTQIKTVYDAACTTRFHTVKDMGYQELSSHQWGVAHIINVLYPNASKDLLLASMYHDCGESYTGDVPFPIKREMPHLKELLDAAELGWLEKYSIDYYTHLSDAEKMMLKFADMVEGALYCVRQIESGNQNAFSPLAKWVEALGHFAKSTPEKEVWRKLAVYQNHLRFDPPGEE